MEPRPNTIIGAFYGHDGCNVVEPFASQSCEVRTRLKNALRQKLVFLSYTNKKLSFCTKYPCICGFGPKKYNTAHIENTKEQLRNKKTFAPVICVFVWLPPS